MKSNLMKSGDEMIGRQSRKRGVAVILALIAVSVATVLGLSLASSRDANVATSSNLSKVASARASAASALDLATTMLAKPGSLDQLGGSAGSTLFQNLTIGGATVRAEVVDVETRLAATSDSAAVEIVVHSDLEGTVQVARAVGRTPSADTAVRADLDGSEFAVLASGSMSGFVYEIDGQGAVVWSYLNPAGEKSLILPDGRTGSLFRARRYAACDEAILAVNTQL
jgi:hypothetical protein